VSGNPELDDASSCAHQEVRAHTGLATISTGASNHRTRPRLQHLANTARRTLWHDSFVSVETEAQEPFNMHYTPQDVCAGSKLLKPQLVAWRLHGIVPMTGLDS